MRVLRSRLHPTSRIIRKHAHEWLFHSSHPQDHGDRYCRPDRASGIRYDLSGRQLVAGCLTRRCDKARGRSPTSTSSFRSKCWKRGATRRIFSSAAMRAYAESACRAGGQDRPRFRPAGRPDAGPPTSARLREKVKLVHDGFKKYAADFANLVGAEIKLGLNETLGLTGSLRGAVHDIETKLKEIDEPRLTSWMLMMRRHEKDFMLRRDQKYVAEIEEVRRRFLPKRCPRWRLLRRSWPRSPRSWRNIRRSLRPGPIRRSKPRAYDASMMKTFRGFRTPDGRNRAGRRTALQGGRSGRGGDARFRRELDADRVCACPSSSCAACRS